MSIVQRLRKILQKDHEEFVTELYRELLNREPDMEGLLAHVNSLSSGTPKMAILKGIFSSEEAHALLAPLQLPAIPRTAMQRLQKTFQKEGDEFVTALYKELLNRIPEVEGLFGYVKLLSSGTPKMEILQDIFSSEEAHALLSSPKLPAIPRTFMQRLQKTFQKEGDEFVTALYRELLNREPDMEGLHGYVNLLSSGTPKMEILQAIFSSKEAHALLVDTHALLTLPQLPEIPRTVMQRLQKTFQKEGHEFVAALYRELLNREPDIEGLSDYVTHFLQGVPKMTIVEWILFSEEARTLLTSSAFSGKPPTVLCIIPTINAIEMTQQCVDSLKNTVIDIPLEIVVVDDGSASDVQQSLQQWARETDVHLILKPENEGFSRSVNAGIKIARGDYVLLVNNDVIFHEVGWLENMVRTIQSAPDIGIVGARLLYPDGTIQHAGAVPLPNGWFDHYHKNQPYDYPPAQLVLDMPALTGALLLIKQTVFQEIGLYSEEYFLGFEDMDFCYRARQKGWRTVYCGPACAIHLEGKTRANPENVNHSFYKTKELEAKDQFWRKWSGVDINDKF